MWQIDFRQHEEKHPTDVTGDEDRRVRPRQSSPGNPLIGYLIEKLPFILALLFFVFVGTACMALCFLSMLAGTW
jgi:hypothetical protein